MDIFNHLGENFNPIGENFSHINFYKKDYMGGFGSLIILFIIMNSYYNFIPIGTGILIAAFILISIGLNLIIEAKTNKNSLNNKI